MAFGIVKWFNNHKGFGFIESNEFDSDIFAHFSEVEMIGFKNASTRRQRGLRTHAGPQRLDGEKHQGDCSTCDAARKHSGRGPQRIPPAHAAIPGEFDDPGHVTCPADHITCGQS